MSAKSKRTITRNQRTPSDDGNMPTEDEVVAYVDESMRTCEGIITYYLCAVIDRGIGEVDLDGLRMLKPNGAKKLHARDMGVELTSCALDAISKLVMDVIVVSGRPVNMRKQERARRRCLELLLPLLASAGVSRVVMESRSESQDKRDREMAVILTRKGWIGSLRLYHARGEDEPRLWIPDQILGTQGLADTDGVVPTELEVPWRRIGKILERRQIEL